MKTIYYSKVIGSLLIFLVFAGNIVSVSAQEKANYITVNGKVKDKQSKKALEYVTVSIPETNIATITNTDGEFTIKVNKNLKVKTLEFSSVGYYTQKIPLKEEDVQDVTIVLTPLISTLQEVIVKGFNPRDLVKTAIGKIEKNNSMNPNLLTGFYRETVKKRRNYIHISEAIIHIYKTSYIEDITHDKTQIYKGRQLLSPKRGDTLMVKLQGGPNLSLYLDVVKNRDWLLDSEFLSNYKFRLENSVMIDERPHYVVNFEPQVVLSYPLLYGRLYIDEKNLTFSRAEFSLNMDDRNKVALSILKKKPFNLRFKPEEINYLITYRQQNGCSYLNYIRSEINFKCDWKRKLFSTNYSIVSEMVVTDRKEQDITKIPSRLAFSDKHSLSDKVTDFYDENFWEDYNIIAPTESLEAAVHKLRKKQ
ncbi:hypothetical protein EZS27_004846 [termite gut metagenome]|uniref:TonB-dependent receptor SusC n=1 Tax=termite gut metagenome TaxID=433724 RepID=A0A5J4SPG7_9ZZZZ